MARCGRGRCRPAPSRGSSTGRSAAPGERRTRPASRRSRGRDLVDPRVDAVRVGLRAVDQALRDLVHHRLDLGVRVVVAAGDQVVVEVSGADDLRQAARGRAAKELELEEAVLRDGVADAEPGVVLGLAGDGGDPKLVARNRDAGAGRLRLSRLVEVDVAVLEVLEERDLVGQVRRARAAGDAGDGHVAALAGRQDAKRIDRLRVGNRRGDCECRKASSECKPQPIHKTRDATAIPRLDAQVIIGSGTPDPERTTHD